MAAPSRIERCFAQPVIPVVWDPTSERSLIARASLVILQGGSIVDLPRVLDEFSKPPLERMELLAHIDLISGLENSEAGVEHLATFPRIGGVVTVHHHLAKPASRLGLLSIVRLFLSDTRAVARGLSIAAKSPADAIELLPAVAAVQAADDFRKCSLPHIAGGLCRTEEDIRAALAAGSRAVTSTRPALWQMNGAVE